MQPCHVLPEEPPIGGCPPRRRPTPPTRNGASSPSCSATWWTPPRLASQLDPEDLREVIRAYQATCAEVIQRFEGHIAQYLGDGLLVYFGYPQAHEDDAQRAIRTGLGIVEVMATLNTQTGPASRVSAWPYAWGSIPGWWSWATMGGGGRQEHLALGETPNIAARLQGLAAPDSLVISEATARLVEGYFISTSWGCRISKGWPTRYECIGCCTRVRPRPGSTWGPSEA